MPFNQSGEIMECLKRPVATRGFIEVEIERTSDFIWIKEAQQRIGIIVCNPDNQIIYANEAAAHLNGFSSVQAMLEMPTNTIATQFELIDEQAEPFPLSQLPHRRVLAGEQKAEALIGYRKSSTTQPMQWSMSKARPVFDAKGKLLLVITILHDMTERM